MSAEARLRTLLDAAGLPPLEDSQFLAFDSYLSLILRWNSRVNLTAVRDEAGILSRHFVESIACARALPARITSLLDFGSGAGFPGVPIAICRPGIAVTLAESQGKKAAFLNEVVRSLGLSAKVHAGRAESLGREFDCVTLRAVDRMHDAVRGAATLVAAGGYLAPMTTQGDLAGIQDAAGAGFAWAAPVAVPGGEDRVILLGVRASCGG